MSRIPAYYNASIQFLLIFLSSIHRSHAFSASSPSQTSVKFRPGKSRDELEIKITMTRNLMNPLNLDSKRFIVAVDPSNDSQIYGWAQLRPIGFNLQNAQEYDALPGSGSVESDIEEEIWQEFEDDPVGFPEGFASLPWTKEYREFSKASSDRRKKRMQLMERAERQRIRGQNQLWELASVFVKPQWRTKGIGSELIQRVMAKHVMVERSSRDVYLLTLDSTQDWYRSFGFELTDKPPASMAGEITAGNVITGLMGSKLVCMKGGAARQ